MNKTDSDISLQQGHRERLRQRFLAGHLVEYEIIELLLTYVIPRRDVRPLSRQLYKKYGNVYRLLSAPYESLIENPGIKEHTATFFKVIHKLMELDYKYDLKEMPVFHDREKLERYCRLLVGGKTVEEFHVLYLDVKYRLLEDELHSSGTNTWTAVYIREIVKKALDLNARHVLLVHNHLTPDTTFSSQDILLTQDLKTALEKLDIKLFDHFVVTDNIVYSARNMLLLNN